MKKHLIYLVTTLVFLLGFGALQAQEQLTVAGITVDLNQTGYINGTGITPTNSVYYIHESKTLRLNNANIVYNLGPIISSVDGLSIVLINNNFLTVEASYGYDGLDVSNNTTIKGSGTLTTKGINGIGISSKKLTIEGGCTVVAQANTSSYGCGIRGFSNSAELIIKNSTVKAIGSSGSIAHLTSLTLEDCRISQPAGAVYRTDKDPKGVYLGETLVTTEVQIVPIVTYPLYVAGVQVNEFNASNITSASITAGTVSYNPSTLTLTLNNANIVYSSDSAVIYSKVNGLKIVLVGENTANNTKTHSGSGIRLVGNTIIKGLGTLTVRGNIGIYLQLVSTLSIEGGCMVTTYANGNGRGIAGQNTNEQQLIIDGSTFRAKGKIGSIFHLGGLTLQGGCEILQPVGAVYDNTNPNKGLYLNDTLVTTEVIIGRPVSQVTNVQAAVNEANVILTWEAPALLSIVLLSERFDSGMPADWTQIDANSDGYIWNYSSDEGHNAPGSVKSDSYIPGGAGNIAPDNYLITPLVNGAKSINYWVAVHNINYPAEKYAVMASSTGTNAEDFTVVFEETLTGKGDGSKDRNETPKLGTWYERTVNLPVGTKYVAFRHYDCFGQWAMYIDDVTVYGETDNFTYTITRNNEEIATGISATTYTDNNVINGSYNYCVKAVYADIPSLPSCVAPVTVEHYAPASNVQAAVVDLANVNITWDAPAKGREVLLSEGFDSGIPAIWTQIDANSDGNIWNYSSDVGHNASGSVKSDSYISGGGGNITPDNYLITPLVNGARSINYWVVAHSANWPAEKYAVMASSTGTNAEDFSVVFEEILTAKGDGSKDRNETPKLGTWYERTVNLPAGTKYVAFRHYDCFGQWAMYIDDVTVYGEASNHTYTITRNNEEVATGVTATAYADNNVANGTYEYCVKVDYEIGTSAPACAASVTVEYYAPASNVQATVNVSDVNITWAAPAGASGYTYTVTRSGVEIATGITETTYADNNVPNGTYDYCVKVVYAGGTSAPVCADPVTVEAQTSYTITFNVLYSGTPLQGATINVADKELTTDEQGSAVVQLVNGSYAYTVTKEGYDTHESEFVVEGADQTVTVNMTGIEGSAVGNIELLYPNPVESTLTIERNCSDEVVMEIYSINGVLVGTIKTERMTTTIDVGTLGSGSYFIRIVGTDETKVYRFIKR